MTGEGLMPQSIPPLLTRSGSDFEKKIERAVEAATSPHISSRDYSQIDRWVGKRQPNNALLVADLKALPPGSILYLSQVRLEEEVEGWLGGVTLT